jgi:hypothetical protein
MTTPENNQDDDPENMQMTTQMITQMAKCDMATQMTNRDENPDNSAEDNPKLQLLVRTK